MSLANNHLNDYGDKAVNFTRGVLRNVGIESFGLNFGSRDTPQVCSSSTSIACQSIMDHSPIRQTFKLVKFINTAGKSIINLVKL